MMKNRTVDIHLTQKQRAEKYGLPLHVVRRKDQGKIYCHLTDTTEKKGGPTFLIPPTQVLVFESIK
jgi:hypothetical protein